ncbi:pilin, partial [Patescibacteria group bacterium]|nr:pilin [Patescibacteria group bacterium]
FVLMLTLAPLGVAKAGNFLKEANTKLGTAVEGVGFEKTLETSISAVVKGALSLVGTIFFLLTIYAGILWMTAAGEEERVTRARKIITAAIVGLIITMAAYAITAFITSAVGGGGGGTTPPAVETDAGGGNGGAESEEAGVCVTTNDTDPDMQECVDATHADCDTIWEDRDEEAGDSVTFYAGQTCAQNYQDYD